MPKRISWKKGMRLTDEILIASDQCTDELMAHAFALAAGGRFGLLPSLQPFEAAIDVNKNIIDVASLHCTAITRDGSLIDAHLDTMFGGGGMGTRLTVPTTDTEQTFLLTINANQQKWRDTAEGYREMAYTFELLPEQTPLPPSAMPIVRVVNQLGWRADDVDFVPPCLFVSASSRYMELCQRFEEVLARLDSSITTQMDNMRHTFTIVFWPVLQQLLISQDKESELLTPMMLLGRMQRLVSAFVCACELDERFTLNEPETFNDFLRTPYHYQNAYAVIRQGLALCLEVAEKTEKISKLAPEPKPEPAPAPAPKRPTPPPPPPEETEEERLRRLRWEGLSF